MAWIQSRSIGRGLLALMLMIVFGSHSQPAPAAEHAPTAAHTNGGAFLIDDYNQHVETYNTSAQAADYTPLSDSRLVFSALNSASGRELWVTDGSSATTQLLADLVPGVASGDPQHLHAIDGEAWFWAFDAIGGPRKLWRTDGTAAGTHVFDLAYDYVSAIVEGDDLVKLNARLLFVGVDAAGGAELWRSNGTSSDTVRVKDINPGPAGSDPHLFTVAGGWLYFTAFDGTSWGLWRTDRNAANTTLVQADVQVEEMVVDGPALYFRATRADGTCGLWRSDGTPTGTQHLGDMCGSELTIVNDNLVFLNVARSEIWLYNISNGSSAKVCDVLGSLRFIVTLHGRLVFFTTDGLYRVAPQPNTEPIQVGSAYDTVEVTATADLVYASSTWIDFYGRDSSLQTYDGQTWTEIARAPAKQITPWGNQLVFSDAFSGNPWILAAGTTTARQLQAINTPAPASMQFYNSPDSQELANIGGAKYMDLYDAHTQQHETIAINPSDPSIALLSNESHWNKTQFGPHTLLFPSPPIVLTEGRNRATMLPIGAGAQRPFIYNNAVYALQVGDRRGYLWRTDGTLSGTSMLKQFNFTLPIGSDTHSADDIALLGNTLVLWYPKTAIFINLDTLTATAQSLPFTLTQTKAIFQTNTMLYIDSAMQAPYNAGLWATDGTPQNTRLLYDNVDQITMLGATADQDALYLSIGPLSDHTTRFYRTDPTTSTLTLLGTNDDRLRYHQMLPNNTLMIITDDSTTNEISVSALSASSMQTLQTFPANYIIDYYAPALLGERLLLRSSTSASGDELWASDGTISGTVQLTDINPGPYNSQIRFVGQVQDREVFTGRSTSGAQLWSTDGTPGGTAALVTAPISNVTVISQTSDTLLFSADTAAGHGLWISDGTAAGTHRLSTCTDQPSVLGILNDSYLIALSTSATGRELWATTPSRDGLTLLADSMPGPDGSDPQALGSLPDQTLLYSADDGVHGRELWRSDGTAVGTQMVTELTPGPADMLLQADSAVVIDGRLLFGASDGRHGVEPWVSDGTRLGTRMLADIAPGIASGVNEPAQRLLTVDVPERQPSFERVGDYLVFYANDLVHGYELWALPWASVEAQAQVFLPLLKR